MEILEAKKKVIEAGFMLVKTGLIARTWGNVSCRVDEKTFVITPSGRDYLTLTEEEIVEVNISDLEYQGDIKPSSEKGIHAEVYKLYQDINFVIHTHQENASAISAMGIDSVQFTKSYPELGTEVICAKYALPGTKALRKNVVEAMKISSGKAIILKHHGTVCMGVSEQEAFAVANTLEEACHDYLAQIGGLVFCAQPENSEKLVKLIEKLVNTDEQEYAYVINQDPQVIKFSQLNIKLKPLLDDFAQIVGINMKTVEYSNSKAVQKAFQNSSAVFIQNMGAICRGINSRDAEAVSMILSKNTKAYFGAISIGKPQYINFLESRLMRNIYRKKYSTLASK